MAAFALVLALAMTASDPPSSTPDEQEIVVTGERTPTRVRDTASSVVVMGQSQIEASGAHRIDQLLAAIPNVQLGNGSQGPSIRGMDTTGPLFALPAFLGGNRPRTTIVVDGRPVTYNEFVFGAFPLWDLERVEVYRSPQTTTQGTNSIAGAIFVHTNDPGSEREGRARVIAGNLQARQVSALVSGPIGDDVALRIAGDWRSSRTSSRILDEIEDGDPNDNDQAVIRAKLVATPSLATRAELTYVHSRSQSPQIVGVMAPFAERRDNGGYGVFRIRVHSLTAVATQQFSPDFRVTATLSGGISDSRRLAIPNFGQARNDGRDWSAEAVFDWSPDGPVRLVGGFAHQHKHLRQYINLSDLSGAIGRFRDRQDGGGVFADAKVEITPRLNASVGLRYQRDRQRRQGALTANTFVIPIDYLGTFDAWLPKATLSYDVTKDVTLGALVQKAHNPGGTTIRVDTGRPDEFDDETLWDYEGFVRATFAGGRASASINFFTYDMRDAQRARNITIFTPSGRRVGFSNLFNVARARSRGAEAQLSWRGSRLAANVAVGLLDTKIIEADGEAAHLKGNDFERSPHFTGSAAVDWRPTDKLRVSAQVRHHGPYFSNGENASTLRISSGTTLDARAEYRIGRCRLFGQVRNLLDEYNLVDLDAVNSGESEDPRVFAIGIEANF